MAVADKLAVLAGAEPDVVAGFGAVGRDGETLVARRHELDRSFELLRGKRDQRGPWGHTALGAESAAGEMADHMDLVRINAEALGNAVLQPVNKLTWLVD